MEVEGVPRPHLRRARDGGTSWLFLASLRCFEPGGSPLSGESLITERGCAPCHGQRAEGASGGPALRGPSRSYTLVTFAEALWNHGPKNVSPNPRAWPRLAQSGRGRYRGPAGFSEHHLAGGSMMQLVETVFRIASRNRLFLMGFVLFFLAGGLRFSLPTSRKRPACSRLPSTMPSILKRGLECTTCHVGAEDQQHATLPTLENVFALPPRGAD